MANITWAFAILEFRPDARSRADLGEAAVGQVARFTPQGMSNIIWAWATLAFFHRPLFDATADLLKQRSSEGDLGEVLSEWKAQELSNTAWAFATVLYVHPASAAMAHAALRRLDEFHARHSANLAWALATLEFSQRPLLVAFAERVAHMSEVAPLSLASIAWACVSMEVRHAALLDRMAGTLFKAPVDEGLASMAVWTLSRAEPDLRRAFRLVLSARWRIPPVSLSALLEECEQRGLHQEERRVLRLMEHGDLAPVVMEVRSRLHSTQLPRPGTAGIGSGGEDKER